MASLLVKVPMSLLIVEQRPGVRSIAMLSVRTTILTSYIEQGPYVPLFITYLLFTIGKSMLDKNYIEFDFMNGPVHVPLSFL